MYLDRHRLAIVCSARSGSSKALGTTNLLLRAASEAVPTSRSASPCLLPGPSAHPHPSAPRPFDATIELLRSDHITAAKQSVTDPLLLNELLSEIDRDCDALRGLLLAVQVLPRLLGSQPIFIPHPDHRRDIPPLERQHHSLRRAPRLQARGYRAPRPGGYRVPLILPLTPLNATHRASMPSPSSWRISCLKASATAGTHSMTGTRRLWASHFTTALPPSSENASPSVRAACLSYLVPPQHNPTCCVLSDPLTLLHRLLRSRARLPPPPGGPRVH